MLRLKGGRKKKEVVRSQQGRGIIVKLEKMQISKKCEEPVGGMSLMSCIEAIENSLSHPFDRDLDSFFYSIDRETGFPTILDVCHLSFIATLLRHMYVKSYSQPYVHLFRAFFCCPSFFFKWMTPPKASPDPYQTGQSVVIDQVASAMDTPTKNHLLFYG